MTIDTRECKKVLEAGIGEANYVIPDDVLKATIEHLTAYEELRLAESWRIERLPARRDYY